MKYTKRGGASGNYGRLEEAQEEAQVYPSIHRLPFGQLKVEPAE